MRQHKQMNLTAFLVFFFAVVCLMEFAKPTPLKALPMGSWESHWTAGAFAVNRVVVDSTEPRIVFAATSRGVYKSTDGGLTWNLKPTGLPGNGTQNIVDLALDPCNHSTVYILEGSHVRISTNGGENWSDLHAFGSGLVSVKGIAVGCNSSNLLVASAAIVGGADYIDRSSDGGVVWTNKFTIYAVGGFTKIAIDPENSQVAYATHDGELVIYKSNTSGDTWNPCYNNISYLGVRDIDFRNGQIWVTGNARYLGVQHGFYKSVDGGLHWSVGKDDFAANVTSLTFDDLGNIYVGTSAAGGVPYGVYKCDKDITSCQQINSGLGSTLPDIYDLAHGGGMLHAATNLGMSRYQTWEPSAWIYLPVIAQNP